MPLVCRNLSKEYLSRQGEVLALNGLNFSVEDFEFVSIVGPSGCGKTTLLKLIAGLLKPTVGSVEFSFPGHSNQPDLP